MTDELFITAFKDIEFSLREVLDKTDSSECARLSAKVDNLPMDDAHRTCSSVLID